MKSEIQQAIEYSECRIYEHLDNLDNHRGKWMNLIFDKRGRSYAGLYEFNSEAQAAEQVEYVLGMGEEIDIYLAGDGTEIPRAEFSHAIQIPVGI